MESVHHRHHHGRSFRGMEKAGERGRNLGQLPYAEADPCSTCAGCNTPDALHCPKRGAASSQKINEAKGEPEVISRSTEEKLLELFHRATHLFPRGHHHSVGMHPGQSRILALLAEKGPISQRELLDLVQVRSASLSELLHKLERGGFIERERDGEDRRNVNLSLTTHGKKAAREDAQVRGERAKTTFAALSDEEKSLLVDIMEKLIPTWADSEISNRPSSGPAIGHRHGHGRHHGPHHKHRGRGAPGPRDIGEDNDDGV